MRYCIYWTGTKSDEQPGTRPVEGCGFLPGRTGTETALVEALQSKGEIKR